MVLFDINTKGMHMMKPAIIHKPLNPTQMPTMTWTAEGFIATETWQQEEQASDGDSIVLTIEELQAAATTLL